MHRLADSIKNRLHSRPTQDKGTTMHVLQDPSSFPSPSDFFRYRKQRGVNLGEFPVPQRGNAAHNSLVRVMVRPRTMDSRGTLSFRCTAGPKRS